MKNSERAQAMGLLALAEFMGAGFIPRHHKRGDEAPILVNPQPMDFRNAAELKRQRRRLRNLKFATPDSVKG